MLVPDDTQRCHRQQCSLKIRIRKSLNWTYTDMQIGTEETVHQTFN